MDAAINGNPVARVLLEIYRPIAKTSINVPAGILIDLLYGFGLASIFLMLYRCLPGANGIQKGCSFGALVWFLRVAMSVASTWMMLQVPFDALLYLLATGMAEMLVLGLVYGLLLSPRSGSA